MNQVLEFRLCWSNCVQYHLHTAAIIAVTQVVSFLNEKQFVSKYFTLMKMVTVLRSLEEAWFWKYIHNCHLECAPYQGTARNDFDTAFF